LEVSFKSIDMALHGWRFMRKHKIIINKEFWVSWI
jgi:hypothetical protein